MPHMEKSPLARMPNIFKIQRIIKGLRQADVEKAIGIPQPRLSLIERGLPPSKEELKRLSELFNMPETILQQSRLRPSKIKVIIQNN